MKFGLFFLLGMALYNCLQVKLELYSALRSFISVFIFCFDFGLGRGNLCFRFFVPEVGTLSSSQALDGAIISKTI